MSRFNLGKNQLQFWDEINWNFGDEINKKNQYTNIYDLGEDKNHVRLFYLFGREVNHMQIA
jgi:hypothetical protein